MYLLHVMLLTLLLSKQVMTGFSRNYAAYHQWCITRHARAGFVKATFEIANMNTFEISGQKDCRPSEMKVKETYKV